MRVREASSVSTTSLLWSETRTRSIAVRRLPSPSGDASTYSAGVCVRACVRAWFWFMGE